MNSKWKVLAAGGAVVTAFLLAGPLQHLGVLPETAVGDASKNMIRAALDAVPIRGTLTYAKPGPDGTEQVVWRLGRPPDEKARAKTRANVETALYSQRRLLEQAFATLKVGEPGRVNLYLLAVAGDGAQEVFRREVDYVEKQFAQRFDTADRAVTLVNSRSTAASAPMATVTSIRESLRAIAARMQVDEDILFVLLTSHGSKDHELRLRENGMELEGLRAPVLAGLLKESGIRWKVVVVSACYGGGFIDDLQDGHTLVITAARQDRRSFGCKDDNDFTYFGRAYFKESLPKASSFEDAFYRAEVLVHDWELKDVNKATQSGLTLRKRIDENRSLPQISSSPAVAAHLRRWWAENEQLKRTAERPGSAS